MYYTIKQNNNKKKNNKKLWRNTCRHISVCGCHTDDYTLIYISNVSLPVGSSIWCMYKVWMVCLCFFFSFFFFWHLIECNIHMKARDVFSGVWYDAYVRLLLLFFSSHSSQLLFCHLEFYFCAAYYVFHVLQRTNAYSLTTTEFTHAHLDSLIKKKKKKWGKKFPSRVKNNDQIFCYFLIKLYFGGESNGFYNNHNKKQQEMIKFLDFQCYFNEYRLWARWQRTETNNLFP